MIEKWKGLTLNKKNMSCNINNELNTVKRFKSEDLMEVYRLQDKANEDGFRNGLYCGAIAGIALTLIALIIIINK